MAQDMSSTHDDSCQRLRSCSQLAHMVSEGVQDSHHHITSAEVAHSAACTGVGKAVAFMRLCAHTSGALRFCST